LHHPDSTHLNEATATSNLSSSPDSQLSLRSLPYTNSSSPSIQHGLPSFSRSLSTSPTLSHNHPISRPQSRPPTRVFLLASPDVNVPKRHPTVQPQGRLRVREAGRPCVGSSSPFRVPSPTRPVDNVGSRILQPSPSTSAVYPVLLPFPLCSRRVRWRLGRRLWSPAGDDGAGRRRFDGREKSRIMSRSRPGHGQADRSSPVEADERARARVHRSTSRARRSACSPVQRIFPLEPSLSYSVDVWTGSKLNYVAGWKGECLLSILSCSRPVCASNFIV
jgi:hypothetical protein